jgi:hypothetical protein
LGGEAVGHAKEHVKVDSVGDEGGRVEVRAREVGEDEEVVGVGVRAAASRAYKTQMVAKERNCKAPHDRLARNLSGERAISTCFSTRP